ncbi:MULTISPECIES: HIT domain-containing protein [unclassified Corynebacterium]|uniref:HIT family protein n=1 Tax=unclassified Corynebacterium TaxID=2624378 RepID=UPI0029CA4A75|nr:MULTISPECIES: HIT domain-containing protein [unclassified Corynebacterium]WPF65210.1 HIT domain-containing protein [Corynebacterium sp. 22KM0430]WPF67705.1 HIT domain-containing protein [Corynebacterium sp. 21KM1197]
MRNALPHDAKDTWADTGAGEPDRLQRLWAPYRMNYVASVASVTSTGSQPAEGPEGASQSATKPTDPFVAAPQGSDEDGLIVARGERVYCLLNLFPYNAGHMMVVPYRKVADLEALTAEESAELMAFAQMAVRTLKRVSRPQGINVGLNLGHGSGGSVRDHLHMHVVPRWAGDANFMTVLAGTKVLPQTLRQTRALLAQGWAEIAQEDSHA